MHCNFSYVFGGNGRGLGVEEGKRDFVFVFYLWSPHADGVSVEISWAKESESETRRNNILFHMHVEFSNEGGGVGGDSEGGKKDYVLYSGFLCCTHNLL